MKQTERKEVTRTTVENVLIGRKCNICGKEILPVPGISTKQYNYFVIHTEHHDWGNDSVESIEERDACCPECVLKFTETYVTEAYENAFNSKEIEIRHVRSLYSGASD